MTIAMPTNQATFVSMAKPEENSLIKCIKITKRETDVVMDIERKVWIDNKHVTPPYMEPYGGDYYTHKEIIIFAQDQIEKIQKAFSVHKAVKSKLYSVNCITGKQQSTTIPLPHDKMTVIDSFSPRQLTLS